MVNDGLWISECTEADKITLQSRRYVVVAAATTRWRQSDPTCFECCRLTRMLTEQTPLQLRLIF